MTTSFVGVAESFIGAEFGNDINRISQTAKISAGHTYKTPHNTYKTPETPTGSGVFYSPKVKPTNESEKICRFYRCYMRGNAFS